MIYYRNDKYTHSDIYNMYFWYFYHVDETEKLRFHWDSPHQKQDFFPSTSLTPTEQKTLTARWDKTVPMDTMMNMPFKPMYKWKNPGTAYDEGII